MRQLRSVLPGVLGPALVTALVTALLVGCSSQESDYCAALKDQKATFTKLADDAAQEGSDYLTTALTLFETMRAEAPDSLRDEWDTVVFAWSDLIETLRDVGIDPRGFDPSKRPDGVSVQEFNQVKQVAAKLSSLRVRDAVGGINEQARDVCKTDLSL